MFIEETKRITSSMYFSDQIRYKKLSKPVVIGLNIQKIFDRRIKNKYVILYIIYVILYNV